MNKRKETIEKIEKHKLTKEQLKTLCIVAIVSSLICVSAFKFGGQYGHFFCDQKKGLKRYLRTATGLSENQICETDPQVQERPQDQWIDMEDIDNNEFIWEMGSTSNDWPDLINIKKELRETRLDEIKEIPCEQLDQSYLQKVLKPIENNINILIDVDIHEDHAEGDRYSITKEVLDQQSHIYDDAFQFTNPDYLKDVQQTALQMKHVYKEQINTKNKLNDYRNMFIDQIDSLSNEEKLITENVQKKMEERTNEVMAIDEEIETKNQTINDLNVEINKEQDKLEQLDNLQEKKDLLMKLQDYRTIKAKNEASLNHLEFKEQEKQNLINNIDKTKQNIEEASEELSQVEESLKGLDEDKKNKLFAFKKLNDEKQAKTVALEIRLNLQKTKDFIQSLLNKNKNIGEFSALMEKKISKEEQLIQIIEKFKEDYKDYEEIENEDGDVLQDAINKDRAMFKEIVEKYINLKKVVDEYEEKEIDISALRVKLVELKNQIEEAIKEIKEIDSKIDTLKQDREKKATFLQRLQIELEKENGILSGIEAQIKDLRERTEKPDIDIEAIQLKLIELKKRIEVG